METYKLIRKICLYLAALVGIFIFLGTAIQEGNFSSKYVGQAFMIGALLYIGVYILFAVIYKIIQAVKKDTGKMKVFSDKQYLEAYSEVEENNIQNKELWAKAFAQCGGDKEKQKSIYVELRTKELSKNG